MRSLSMLAPIVPGEELALDAYLRALDREIFTGLADVHFARWVIVGESTLGPRRHRLRMRYLLFSVAHERSTDEIVEALRTGLAGTADGVWGHCVGYPSWRAAAAFRSWFSRGLLPVRARFVEWPDLTPAQVHDALALRQEHIAFAVDAAGLDDVALRERFLERFPS